MAKPYETDVDHVLHNSNYSSYVYILTKEYFDNCNE